MPKLHSTIAPQLIGGVRELAPRYQGFILDLWGVIHDGVSPLPGAVECLRTLVEHGKRIVLLSNAPRRAADVIRRIAAIGVPAAVYHHVMSSGEEAWQHLDRRDDPFYATLGRRCLNIGSERDLEIREGLGLEYVESAEEAEFILNTGPAGWEDRLEDYEPLMRASLDRDLPMVCANPDLVVMHGSRLALCAGALAKWYEEAGGRVRSFAVHGVTSFSCRHDRIVREPPAGARRECAATPGPARRWEVAPGPPTSSGRQLQQSTRAPSPHYGRCSGRPHS